MSTHRSRPLSIHDAPEPLAMSAAGLAVAPAADDARLVGEVDERRQRIADGLRQLGTGLRNVRLDERALMVAGGVLAPTGLVLVLLGWYGAARTPYLFEQVPYLISGGLFGVALVFVGAFAYFAHWMTAVVKEQREHTAAVVGAIEGLRRELEVGRAATGAAPAVLVCTARGTMAHRPDCSVVAGRDGLRPVTAGDGLDACRLCDPYRSDDP